MWNQGNTVLKDKMIKERNIAPVIQQNVGICTMDMSVYVPFSFTPFIIPKCTVPNLQP
jgi:hypothetical protein